MKNIIFRIGKKVILFVALILLTSINLSAQYKLELEWQKDTEWITSITKSDNDSLLYVAFENFIVTVKTSDGSIIKEDSVDGSYNLIMSKDGKTLVAASNYGVGLLDPITFKKIFWSSPDKLSDNPSLMLNEVQYKFVICGSPSLIWIYDVKTKSLDKELKVKYSEPDKTILRNARLTYNGKYIIYSYVTNIQKFKNYIKIMDLEGNIVKEFLETSSTLFSLTNDSKTLVYFKSATIHFFDLETMKEKASIPYIYENPEGIEMSNDGKFMLIGLPNGLIYCDFETKQIFFARDFGTWRKYVLNSDNSSLFSFLSNTLYRFNFQPNSIKNDIENKLELTINIIDNKLILTNLQNHLINTLTAYDILGRTYPLSANGNEVDVSALAVGKYFLKVGLADGSFLDFGFVVE